MSRGAGRAPPPGADGGITWADVATCRDAGLAETTSERGRGSLRNVWEALESQYKAGVPITFAGIGALCMGKHGWPTAQSIQNNVRLARMVRIATQAQSAGSKPQGGRPVEEVLLAQIGNLELRAELAVMLEHRRSLIVTVNQLRLAARTSSALGVISQEMAQAGIETLEDLSTRLLEWQRTKPEAMVSEEERMACRDFLEAGLPSLQCRIDPPSGEIVDRSLRTVARRGVAAALGKIAAL